MGKKKNRVALFSSFCGGGGGVGGGGGFVNMSGLAFKLQFFLGC